MGKGFGDGEPLRLACGGCLGCRARRAKEWALRCQLELQDHERAVFSTLTYAPDVQPVTLCKRHVQLFLKRLRRAIEPEPLRFFLSGEYGERTYRPHYHAILFGVGLGKAEQIEDVWGMGHVRSYDVTPAMISYVAGYSAKKIGFRLEAGERVDPETGEVYEWQPPFIQMSRRPGIGDRGRQWPESWRKFAVHNGSKVPVPRFLHESWRNSVDDISIEELAFEKFRDNCNRDFSERSLLAKEARAISMQALCAEGRSV